MSKEKGIKGLKAKSDQLSVGDAINHREEIEAGEWGEEARQELIETDKMMKEVLQNENIQQAMARIKQAHQVIHKGYRDPNAPIGLKVLSYFYFDKREDPRKKLALGDLLKVLNEDFNDFKLPEVSGILLSYQKEKEEVIMDAEMKHKEKEQDKYMLLGFVSGIEAAARGELDKYIKTFVTSRLIDEQRRRQRASEKGDVVSLQDSLYEDGMSSLIDIIQNPNASDPANIFIDILISDKTEITEKEREKLLEIDKINKTDVQILEIIFKRQSQNQTEVAQEVGCKQPRVSKAIKKIKKHKKKIVKILGFLE